MKFGNYNLANARTERPKSLLLFRFKKVKSTANHIVGKFHHTIGTFRRMRSESPLSFRASLFDKKYIESDYDYKFKPEDFPTTHFKDETNPFAFGNDIKRVVQNQKLIGPGPRGSAENFYSSVLNLNEIEGGATMDKRSLKRKPKPVPENSKDNILEYLNAKQIDESMEYEVLKEYFDTYSYSDIVKDLEFKNYLSRKNYNDILEFMQSESLNPYSAGHYNSSGTLSRKSLHVDCRSLGRNRNTTTGSSSVKNNNITTNTKTSITIHNNYTNNNFNMTSSNHNDGRISMRNSSVGDVSLGEAGGGGRKKPHFHGEMEENLLTLRKYATMDSIYNHSQSDHNLADETGSLRTSRGQPKLIKTLQHNYCKSKSAPTLKYFYDVNDELDEIDLENNRNRIQNFSKIASDTKIMNLSVTPTSQKSQSIPNNINEHYSTFPTQKVKNKNFSNSLKRIKNVFNANQPTNVESSFRENIFKFHDKNCSYARNYCEIVQFCQEFFAETELPKLSSKSDFNCKFKQISPAERHKSMPNISTSGITTINTKKFNNYDYKKIILGYVKSKGCNSREEYVEAKFGKILDRTLKEDRIFSTQQLKNHSEGKPIGKSKLSFAKLNFRNSCPKPDESDIQDSIQRFIYEDAFKTFDYVRRFPPKSACSSCGQLTIKDDLYKSSDSCFNKRYFNDNDSAKNNDFPTIRYKKNPQPNSLGRTKCDMKRDYYTLNRFNSLNSKNCRSINRNGYRDQIFSEEMASLVPPGLQGKEDVLFGNLNELHSFHSDVFLKDLENCISTTELVALCFVQRRDTFYRLYSYYCQNIPRSEQLRETLVDTHLFLQECQKRLGHKLPLAAYLLKPVQRITKYQLLLKDLLRFSDNGTCAKELQKALDCMLIVLKCVNDSMHQIAITGFPADLDHQGELLLQDSFQVWTDSKKDLRLRLKTQQRHIFLYQKAMLFCKQASKTGHNKSTYQYKHYVKMSQIGLTESVRGDPRKFEVWLQGRLEVHTIQAATVEIKNKWVTEIKRVLLNQLEELKGEKIKQYGLNQKPLKHATSWEASVSITSLPQRAVSVDVGHDHKISSHHINVSNLEAIHNLPPAISSSSSEMDNQETGAWSSDYSNSEDEYTHIEDGVCVAPGGKFVALADYCAMGNSEVTMKEGDMVELVKVGCAGWWFVKVLGGSVEGWAPAAYLESLNRRPTRNRRSQDRLNDY